MAQTDQSGGMSPARDPLNGRLRTLRLGLIILPLIGLVISITAYIYFVEDLRALRPNHSFVFLVLHNFLYTLPFQALSLWAGLAMRPRPETGPEKSPLKSPVESFVKSLVTWILIGFALMLPVTTLVYDIGFIGGWVTNLRIGGALYLTPLAAEMFITLSFAAICIFAALQNTGANNIGENISGNSRAEMNKPAAILRAALIILPLLAVGLTALSSGILFIDMALRQYTGSLMSHLAEFIIPLTYLAIGLWASHLIKPLKGLDLETLKWGLIILGVALPIVTLFADYQLYKIIIRPFEDKTSYLSFLLTTEPKYLLRAMNVWFNTLLFTPICFFFAHKMDEAGEKKGVGYSA